MKTKRHTIRWLGLALASGAITCVDPVQAGQPPPPPSGPAYRIVSLGSLSGWTPADSGYDSGWIVSKINEAGRVVGSSDFVPYDGAALVVDPEPSAVGPVYFRDTSPEDGRNDLIVRLPGTGPSECAAAYGLNDAGWVVGASNVPVVIDGELEEHGRKSTLWLDHTPIHVDEGPRGPFPANEAYGVNNRGVVMLGMAMPEFGDECFSGFVAVPGDADKNGIPDTWCSDEDGDGVNDLLKLVQVAQRWGLGMAAINEAGQIVMSVDGRGHRLTPDTDDSDGDGNPWFADVNADGINDLLVKLIGLDGAYGNAYDINEAGQVVGSSAARAVRWDFAGGIQKIADLGALSKGVRSMRANAINDKGQIVGTASYRNYRTSFLVHDGTMHDLAALLVNGAGWSNLSAVDLNNRGYLIGMGNLDGVRQPFVAIPCPDPGNLSANHPNDPP